MVGVREKEPEEQEVVFKSNIGVYVFKVKVFLCDHGSEWPMYGRDRGSDF